VCWWRIAALGKRWEARVTIVPHLSLMDREHRFSIRRLPLVILGDQGELRWSMATGEHRGFRSRLRI
jgi:hypothetical protein